MKETKSKWGLIWFFKTYEEIIMMNLKVLFLPVCFLYCFSVMAEAVSQPPSVITEKEATPITSPLDSQPPSVITGKEEPTASKDNSTAVEETRNVDVTDQTMPSSFLRPAESNIYSEKLESNRFLEVGLEYPITSFGVNLKYLLTDSVYARLGVGFMYEFFLKSFEKVADSFGYLSEEEAKLLSDTLKNSMYVDLRLAWAPYLKSEGGGPYLELGFSHSRFGKGELKGLTLSQVLDDDSFETTKYLVRTNTYNANFHAGYQIPFEKMKLNFEIGLIKILQTELLDETSPTDPQTLSESQQKTFQDFLETKGWIFPTFSGWISFAF